ncbi:Nuclear pore complex protein NUP155 [Vitis vinifera]|uniref:Nuclear pore complex protein NUP155 n=1 Tax=Vitis vinifera TaxID=29760 RepID=A0A438HXW1_VITVI|nr:Nuclear pore complex protein NUP155 [Vitis vinifera]
MGLPQNLCKIFHLKRPPHHLLQQSPFGQSSEPKRRGTTPRFCNLLAKIVLPPGTPLHLPVSFYCKLADYDEMYSERLASGVEPVGDEDVVRALLAACKGATEPVLNTYEQLLSNGAILPSPNLRLRLLRSVLVVLREWGNVCICHREWAQVLLELL